MHDRLYLVSLPALIRDIGLDCWYAWISMLVHRKFNQRLHYKSILAQPCSPNLRVELIPNCSKFIWYRQMTFYKVHNISLLCNDRWCGYHHTIHFVWVGTRRAHTNHEPLCSDLWSSVSNSFPGSNGKRTRKSEYWLFCDRPSTDPMDVRGFERAVGCLLVRVLKSLESIINTRPAGNSANILNGIKRYSRGGFDPYEAQRLLHRAPLFAVLTWIHVMKVLVICCIHTWIATRR